MSRDSERYSTNWSTLLGHQPKILPPDTIKANIKTHGLPASGRGPSRRITITPATIALFIRPDHIDEMAKHFDFPEIDENAPTTNSLERVVYDATKKKRSFHKTSDGLEALDLDAGVYLTPAHFSDLLPNYDPTTFIENATEAKIPVTTIKKQGRQHWYLLNETTLKAIPRRNLKGKEIKNEIFTANRIQTIADEISATMPGLESGVWVLRSQGAKLLENYTAHYFKRQADTLEIKHEKIFGQLRYFVTKEDLQKFPKKHLTDRERRVIIKLTNLTDHQTIASGFKCATTYVGWLAANRDAPIRIRQNLSNERLTEALYLWFDTPEGPARPIIYDKVLLPVAQLFGDTSTQEPAAFITPFYGLHKKVIGANFERNSSIEAALKHCVTCYTLDDMMHFAGSQKELPEAVLESTPLPHRKQNWTITNYFYLRAME
jgi:hypothetical protein